MVTAELAVALPAVVLTAVLAVTFLSVLAASLHALDAAAVAARLSGRGELAAAITAEVRAVSPGASVRLDTQGAGAAGVAGAAAGIVVAEVSVRVPVPLPGLGRVLPAFVVRERAAAPREREPPS